MRTLRLFSLTIYGYLSFGHYNHLPWVWPVLIESKSCPTFITVKLKRIRLRLSSSQVAAASSVGFRQRREWWLVVCQVATKDRDRDRYALEFRKTHWAALSLWRSGKRIFVGTVSMFVIIINTYLFCGYWTGQKTSHALDPLTDLHQSPDDLDSSAQEEMLSIFGFGFIMRHCRSLVKSTEILRDLVCLVSSLGHRPATGSYRLKMMSWWPSS